MWVRVLLGVQLKQKSMKKFILIPILILLVPISVYSQTQTQTDSLRLEIIDETLREYGKQQSVANKITIVTIVVIGVGTLIGVPRTTTTYSKYGW